MLRKRTGGTSNTAWLIMEGFSEKALSRLNLKVKDRRETGGGVKIHSKL